jgi:hypothetical protein
MLTQYDPAVFSNLNEFEISRQRLAEEETKIPHLGDVICRHNLHQQVGISLLHKHFEMSHDEMLVERFTGDRSFAVPLKRNEGICAVPYMWKAVRHLESESWIFYPLEFVECSDDESFKTVTQNEAFFADIAGALSSLGVADVFGVSLLHREAIRLAEGDTILETSNGRERRLNFQGVSKEKLSTELDLTRTLWAFNSSDGYTCNRHDDCGRHGCAHCDHTVCQGIH